MWFSSFGRSPDAEIAAEQSYISRSASMEDELLTRPSAQANQAPPIDDFGAEFGTPISNINTILPEIDRALGRNKPPDIEYLYVEPFSRLVLPGTREWVSFAVNYYGQYEFSFSVAIHS